MSEPKTPITPQAFAAKLRAHPPSEMPEHIAARDEQIRKQERARLESKIDGLRFAGFSEDALDAVLWKLRGGK